MCTSGRVQQPQHQPGLELGRRRSLALGPSLTHSGEVCMLSLRYKDWMHLTKQNQRHHISKCLPRLHQRVPRSRSAQRAARQCWRRLKHRVGSFFFDPAHNHFIWLGVDLLYIFYIQGWELMKKVGEDPSHLEDLTGLTALMQVRQIVSPIILF